MIKKAVFLAVLLVALSFGSAFADQIDSLSSASTITNGVIVAPQVAPPTNVYVNPGGLGDALIYGYYNVRDNRSNFFNVVNTNTSYGVRATIRFIEGADVAGADKCGTTSTNDDEDRGSIEVLDFHICLTPADVWSGVIKNVGGVATLFSADNDTYIDLAERGKPNWDVFPDAFPNGREFQAAGVSDDQTLEGYFIVIAINQLAETASSTSASCGPNLVDSILDVDNVLFGINYMVSTDTLATFAYDATALGNFSNIPYAAAGPIDAFPNLGDCMPDCAASNPRVAPVNYALTKSNIYSTYDLEAGISGKTEVVVTFPTKNLSQRCGLANDIFDDTRAIVTVYDDEENSPVITCPVSPCEGEEDFEIPYEVNVLNIGPGSVIFTSPLTTSVPTAFEFGWLNVDFTRALSPLNYPHVTSCTYAANTGVCASDAAGVQVTNGLPVIGYTAIDVAGSKSTHLLPVQYSTSLGLSLN